MPIITTTPAAPPVNTVDPLAKWVVTVPSAGRPVSWAEARGHLRLSSDAEQAYVEMLIDAAVDYAEQAMSIALMPRTIRAVYAFGDDLILPRTPVLTTPSVVNAASVAVIAALGFHGHAARLVPSGGPIYPLQVTYQAGYANAAAVPASIRAAILAHVGTMYINRESVTDRQKTVVPHSLEAFYARHCRTPGVG